MSFKHKKQALACAIFSSLSAAAGAQTAATPKTAAEAIPAASPDLRVAILRATAAAKARAPQGAASGVPDTTPPTVTSFTVTPPDDASAPLAQIRLEVKAKDDISGVSSILASLTGPHGQLINPWMPYPDVPAKTYSAHLAVDTNAYMEPGTWKVTAFYLQDLAGNWIFIDAPTLTALGNASFTIANSKAHLIDAVGPTISGGTLVTPSISASATQKGTSLPPLIKADFSAADAGSGLATVAALFCLADRSACIVTQGSEAFRGHLKETFHTWSGQYGLQPGDYILETLQVADQAGNWTSYVGIEFGGTTDFSTLMPGGYTITVTP